jgi:hypothetical protein
MGDSKGVDPEQRADAAGRNLIVAPVREHSRKPDAGAAGAHRRGGARTRLIDPRKRG